MIYVMLVNVGGNKMNVVKKDERRSNGMTFFFTALI